jgi:hypothetical protein
MKAQSLVHRDDVPAGGQVGEDESRLFEKGANESEAVRAVGPKHAECRQVADVDRGAIDVAVRIHRGVHTDDGSVVFDELESVIRTGLLPGRENELPPRFARHAGVEVLVQEFTDRDGVFRVNRMRRDAGIRHNHSLWGQRVGTGVGSVE